MKTDIQIQKDVMDEIKWEPFLNAAEIGVAVKNGIVTLSGQVDSFSKKLAAEKAARKVNGVKAIAEDIQIGVSPLFQRNDTEIAEAVLNAIKWHSAIVDENIKIKVENGHVRIEGEVEWEYQRASATTVIQNLDGVKSVSNLIKLKPQATASDLKSKINSAFHRSATIDADNITVDINGSNVTLRGTVRSLAEKEDAEQAIWNAPGVTTVHSLLEIKNPEIVFSDL